MTIASTLLSPPQPLAVRAPREDLGVVCEPPLGPASEQIVASGALYDQVLLQVAEHDFRQLRTRARGEFLTAAQAYSAHLSNGKYDSDQLFSQQPIILCGHQPQLTHPGVWAKNVVASQLAQQTSGIAINIVVDNDTIRSRSIVVPVRQDARDHTRPELHHAFIPFDLGRTKIPWEEVRIEDEKTFTSFADRVLAIFAGSERATLLDQLWMQTLDFARTHQPLRDVLTFLRRQIEQAGGLSLKDIPLSDVCRLSSFQPFLAHLIQYADSFARIHNAALHDYRQRNSIHQPHVPFRDLEVDGTWIETPFWIWHRTDPIRRPLFVRHEPEGRVTLSDRARFHRDITDEILLDQTHRSDLLASIEARGWKIRTRAVTTTMFSRLFLGDYFIHGIGGAKYDEITDQIIRNFWKLPVPPFQVVTATAYLPFERFEDDCGASHPGQEPCDLKRWHRDWNWNPQHFFDSQGQLLAPWNQMTRSGQTADPQQVLETLNAFQSHLESFDASSPQLPLKLSRTFCASKDCYHRRQHRKSHWHRQLNSLKSRLRDSTGITRDDWQQLIIRQRRFQQNRTIAMYREYPSVLFPASKLQQLQSRLTHLPSI